MVTYISYMQDAAKKEKRINKIKIKSSLKVMKKEQINFSILY